MITLKKFTRSAIDGIGQLLWPAKCVNCGETVSPRDNGLCAKCWQELMQCVNDDYCPRCGKSISKYIVHNGRCPHCEHLEFPLDGIARAGIYSDALRRMVISFKRDRTELVTYLSTLIGPAFRSSEFYDEIESLVPVPLHWRRRLSRGYNQAELLAKAIRHPNAKIDLDLARIRYTKFQPELTPAQRLANVRDAFAVRSGHHFEGKAVCLVDDVKTTGATLNECAKVLKEAGAKRIYGLVIAVAGQQEF